MGTAFEILHQPDFSMLKLSLEHRETIVAEPRSLVSMDDCIQLQTGFRGGVLQSLGRAFGGEHLLLNSYTSSSDAGSVYLAPSTMGDIFHYVLESTRELYLQRGGYLASSPDVQLSGSWQGARGFFSGEGLILLKVSGEGDVFFNTYGGLLEIDVDGAYLVDTGYIVAFESTLSYQVTTLPGLDLNKKMKTFIFGGEALVCRFSGKGKLWVQTRAVRPFLRWVHPFRPKKVRN